MIKEVKFIPDIKIEEKANLLLTRFEEQYGRILNPPVPVDRIIEYYLDLSILWDVIEDTDEEKILGCLEASEKRIILNERHMTHFEEYIGTEAYTKAHEVGHWDLHIVKEGDAVQLPLLLAVDERNVLCRDNRKDTREIQAEMYAAYLLMPHTLIKGEIEGKDLANWPTLYKLKDAFGVTITALTKRLTRLGLVYIAPDGKVYHSAIEASTEWRLF
jgi:hypothetical protein